jgi:hypothetical protein
VELAVALRGEERHGHFRNVMGDALDVACAAQGVESFPADDSAAFDVDFGVGVGGLDGAKVAVLDRSDEIRFERCSACACTCVDDHAVKGGVVFGLVELGAELHTPVSDVGRDQTEDSAALH